MNLTNNKITSVSGHKIQGFEDFQLAWAVPVGSRPDGNDFLLNLHRFGTVDRVIFTCQKTFLYNFVEDCSFQA